MRDWAVAITLLGVSLIVTALLLGLCRFLGGWTWVQAWLSGAREETVQLTKSEHHGSNGYMVTSDSEVVLDISGQYRRYDQISHDLARAHLQPDMTSQPPPILPPPPVSQRKSSDGTVFYRKQGSIESDLPDSLSLELMSGGGGGALQRAMSCDSVSSDTSVILEALDSPQPNGELEIGLEYDNETEDLIVMINSAKDLVGPDPGTAVDSYVRVFLLPDKSTNLQTRVQRRTNDPIFKERFLFGVDRRELGQRTVLLCVYTTDKYTSTVIGEAEIKLTDVDLRTASVIRTPILDSNLKPTDLGELMFSLSYLPTAERLTVVVVKARNVRWSANREVGDPFVKVYLLQNGKKISKKKTSLKKGDSNPIFNEAMIFSVPSHALQNIQVRLSVVDHLSEGKSGSVGHVFVGPHCSGKALSHWNQMMSALRKPIAMWHPLRK